MMNMIKSLLIVVLLCGSQAAEAQFLDRLKKKITEETEKMVIDKTADKAAEKTGEAMDKLLSPDLSMENIFSGIGSLMDTGRLPEKYQFDYLYSMKLTNQWGEILFDYMLNEKEPYMAMKPNMGADLVMVIDEPNNAMVTITGDQVFAMELKSESGDDPEESAEWDSLSDYTVTELPNRTFLGYDCIGHKMENAEHTLIVYVAPEVEGGFGNVFTNKQTNIPPKMQSLAKHYSNGLLMYMQMDDKENKGTKEDASTTMECVSFEKKGVEFRIR